MIKSLSATAMVAAAFVVAGCNHDNTSSTSMESTNSVAGMSSVTNGAEYNLPPNGMTNGMSSTNDMGTNSMPTAPQR
jgi:hypothetical protein